MSRGTWVYDKALGTLVPAAEFYARKYDGVAASSLPCPMVVKDTPEYRSIIDGSVIGGRRQHRDHLKAHGCIEVGNEYKAPAPRPSLPPVAEDIKRAMADEGLRAEAMKASQRAEAALVDG